jgi:Cu2+-exporting ATPase
LEKLATPSTLLLDKTGTITEGSFSLVSFEGPDWVKPLVVALEAESTHPVATALRDGLGLVVVPEVESSRHVIGSGIAGRVAGHDVIIGKPSFVRQSIGAGESSERPSGAAHTEILVAVDGTLVAKARLGDAVRADAAKAIAAIRNAGWHVGIASGDAQVVVDEVARCVGVDAAAASGNASPEEKLAMVERAARRGPVVMVGDGVNDAAAIAAASVGIGVSGGAQASLAAADIYLTRPGLTQLVDLIDGARRTMRLIRLGIGISLAYNVVGVGLAMFGLINPLVAAVMMPASSLTVLLVAWRGRTFAAEGRLS